jgi:hypothetical protein
MNESNSKKEDSLGIARVEEATRLFERAWSTIGLVPRLTPQERRRSKKTPRRACGLVPVLAAMTIRTRPRTTRDQALPRRPSTAYFLYATRGRRRQRAGIARFWGAF